MVEADVNRLLRRLPSVDDVLRSSAGIELQSQHPRLAVVAAARAELDDMRRQVRTATSDAALVEDQAALLAGVLTTCVQSIGRLSLRRDRITEARINNERGPS